MPHSTQRAIFISYRRADSEGEAGRLYDDLVRAYGENSVFMDVSGIAPGLDFREAIDSNVAGCGVLLAVIGPLWASVTDAGGNRRLEDANDFVRLEIAAALARKIPVIPVLVHEATMPIAAVLPENLKELAYRNSVEITHARWNSDVALLTAALKSYVHVPEQAAPETVHATVPVQLPAPRSSASAVPPPRSSRPLTYAGITVLLLAAIGAGAYALLHGGNTAQLPVTAQGSSQPRPEASTTSNRRSPEVFPRSAPPATLSSSAVTLHHGTGADSNSPLGLWQIADARGSNDSLARLRITDTPTHGSVSVQAWGQCQSGMCDWGTQEASYGNGIVETGQFSPRYARSETMEQREVTMTMRPEGNTMAVTVVNTLTSQGGQESKRSLQNVFVRVEAFK